MTTNSNRLTVQVKTTTGAQYLWLHWRNEKRQLEVSRLGRDENGRLVSIHHDVFETQHHHWLPLLVMDGGWNMYWVDHAVRLYADRIDWRLAQAKNL